jgi:hypothetical protein
MKLINKKGIILIFILVTMTLAACQAAVPTVDPSVKITEIAATIQAEFTQKAALTPSATATFTPTMTATIEPATATPEFVPPTATPGPTAWPSATQTMDDNCKWIADITYPDGAYANPNADFVKTWRIKNTGKTTWTTDYRLVYVDGMQGINSTLMVYLTENVPPEATIDISITFYAPKTSNTYYSYWRMYNTENEPFGEPLSMKIFVP